MAVQKAVDLTGSGLSVEDAVADAVDRAGMTLDGVTRFEVISLSGSVDDGRLTAGSTRPRSGTPRAAR